LTKLSHLSFSKCELDDDSCWVLYHSLPKSKRLTQIDLNKNNITDEGLLYLSKVFKQIKIETIDLSDNEISNKGFEILLQDMDNHTGLKWLLLKNNKIFEDLGETASLFVA